MAHGGRGMLKAAAIVAGLRCGGKSKGRMGSVWRMSGEANQHVGICFTFVHEVTLGGEAGFGFTSLSSIPRTLAVYLDTIRNINMR